MKNKFQYIIKRLNIEKVFDGHENMQLLQRTPIYTHQRIKKFYFKLVPFFVKTH